MGKNVYQMVTDRIIEQLESGIIPWEKPWSGMGCGAYNRITKKPYSGINQMLLAHKGEYATFKQWQKLGGKIKAGAKAEIVVFWKMLEFEEQNKEGKLVKKNVPILRYYNVFHISNVEGVEPLSRPEKEFTPIEEGDRVINEYINREHIKFTEENGDDAFYRPSTDSIVVPMRGQFNIINEYYSTVFHEMTHSTGHKNRLDRDGIQDIHFGSETYSKEELIAEIGSATIMNILGIENEKSFRNSVAYIQNWLSVLRNDSRFIVTAAGKADKAVNYIFGETEKMAG